MNHRKTKKGFSFVELLVTIAIMVIVLGSAAAVLKKASDTSTIAFQRAEMQANARVAINSLARDLSQAGAGSAVGFPFGGVTLPAGAIVPFAQDAAGNNWLFNNTFGGTLNAVTPAPNDGPTIDGVNTDGITLVYLDQALLGVANENWGTTPLDSVTPSGANASTSTDLIPPLHDPLYGLNVGDLVILSNKNGAALGQVTNLSGPLGIEFANSAPLGVNKPSAAFGNIASILTGNPPTFMSRIFVISYFIQQLDANGAPIPPATQGTANPNAVDYRLMRMVDGQAPVPVAEHIVNLKFSYDLMISGTESSANPTAAIVVAGTPVPSYGSIRNVYVSVTSRSPRVINRSAGGNGYTYSTMFTNISPRNLSFTNRYK